MSQRTKILTQITGFAGWKVAETRWEDRAGRPFAPVLGYDVPADAVLVLVMKRRSAARCSHCMAICDRRHEQGKRRRWVDLPWLGAAWFWSTRRPASPCGSGTDAIPIP